MYLEDFGKIKQKFNQKIINFAKSKSPSLNSSHHKHEKVKVLNNIKLFVKNYIQHFSVALNFRNLLHNYGIFVFTYTVCTVQKRLGVSDTVFT